MTLSDKLKKALGQSGTNTQTTADTTAQDYSFAGRLRSATAESMKREADYKAALRHEAAMEELKRQTSQRLEREATQERAFDLNMANAEDLALGRIGATHRQAQAYNTAREQAIGAYVDEKIGDTKYTSRKALDEARKAARADYEEQERLYDMYSSDILAGQYAEKAQTAYQEAESAYRQAEADYAGAIKYMQDRREAYPGDINALRAAVERTKKAFEEATAKRDQANQFVRYHKAANEQKAVLRKYGVSADSPDFSRYSSVLGEDEVPDEAQQYQDPNNPSVVRNYTLYLALTGQQKGITAEQAANVRYLYNKYGLKAAKEYTQLLEDTEATAQFAQIAENIAGMDEGFGKALATGAYGAGAGFSQFVTGARNAVGAFAGKTASDTMAQGNAVIRENIDNVIGRGAYDLIVTAANMAPSIVLASALGGAGAATDVAGKIGAAAMGTSAGGNAYAQAMAEGKPAFQSFMYGALTGASEAALQSLIGGINPLMSDEGLTKVALDKIGSTLGKKAAQEGAKKITKVLATVAERAAVIGIKSLFEGGEEYLQDILEPVFRNICFDEKNEFKPFTEEALYSGIIGAIMGGGESAVEYAANDITTGAANVLSYASSKLFEKGYNALNKAISGETLTDDEIKAIAKDKTFRTALSRETGITIEGNLSELTEGVKKAIAARQDNARSEAEKKASGVYYLEKALRGEKVSNSQIDVLFKNEDFARQISEASGVEIAGSNSQKRAAVKQAIEILGQRANVNPEANTATNTAENVEPKTDTTAPAAEEPTIDLARQATEAATPETEVSPNNNAQNINVTQEASQSATEGIGENADKSVGDFASGNKNYKIPKTEVHSERATLDSEGRINVQLESGEVIKFKSLRDITDMLVDRLGFNYISKKPSAKNVIGAYASGEKAITAVGEDPATVAHEVGHYLDDRLSMGELIGIDKLKEIYGERVLKVGYSEKQVSRELMAEFTREYLRNRQQLQKQYPDLVKSFETELKTVDAMYEGEKSLPKKDRAIIFGNGKLYETLRTASDMFNAYASLTTKQRYTAKITNVTEQERMIRNDERTSLREKINKFLYLWDDNALPIKIGSQKAYELALWSRVNLANYINGAIMNGVSNDVGRIIAPGWNSIYDTVTQNVKNKDEYRAKKKEFNEYLNMWDIYDSLTVGQRFDEVTRVKRTIEETSDKTIRRTLNKLDTAIATVTEEDYKKFVKKHFDTVRKKEQKFSTRRILKAIADNLPETKTQQKDGTPYKLPRDRAANIVTSIYNAIKNLSVEDYNTVLEEIRNIRDSLGSPEVSATTNAIVSIYNAVEFVLTHVDEDAIKQNVFTTEDYLNDPKKVKAKIESMLAQNPQFEKAQEQVRDWYNALQDLMVASGIWSIEQLEQLRLLHPHYIGLHRAVDMSDYRRAKTKTGRAEMSGLEFDTIDDMLNYTRKGSDKLIYDAFDQATFFANNVIQRVTDNEIIKAFYSEARFNLSLVNVNQVNPMKGSDYMSLTYYVNGKQRHFYVNDPLVVASLKWTRPSIGGLYAVKIVTDWTKKFSTQFNPGFAIYSNPIRDVSQSYRNSDRINPSKFVFEWVKSFFEVAGNEIQNPFTQKPLRETKTYKAAKDFGLEGSAPWRGMRSRAARDYRIQLDLEEQNAVRAALSHFGVLTTTLSDILKVGNILETTTRYAQVKRDLAAGKNMKQAVLGGQETTTNFGRQGASALYRKLDAVIPFFSANVQGKFNNIRQFVDYDPRTGKFALKGDAGAKFAKTVATWLVPTLLQYVALLANTDDDEKKKRLEAFRAETNYVKNQYWLMWDGNDTFIKIPKPQTLNPLYSLTERAFDKMALDDPLAFNNFIGYAWNELLASNFTDLTNFTGVGTAIALAKNEDWRGVPIDKKEYYNQPGSAKYHYDATTSFPARWIGSMLNYSPQKIDYIVSDNFPAVGNALKSFASEQGLSDLKQRPGDVVLSVLGLKTRVKADSVYSTDIRNEYYNYKRHVLNIATDAKNYFTPDTSQSEAKKYGENLAQNAIYTSFNNRIYGTISDAIKRINNAEDKRSANKKLNQLLTSLSDVHGEASGGGTQLDKDIATMYSDYDLFQQMLSSKNLDYWQGSATGKTSTGKKETLTASSILSIAPSANALKTAIEATGDSYADIAADIGITEKTLNNYASGTQRIPDDRVKALAARLGVSEEALTPATEDEWLEAVNRTVAYYSMVEVALNKAWDEFTQTKEYKAAPNREKLRVFEEMRNNACYQALKIISEERYG